jgi:hypothetical protein
MAHLLHFAVYVYLALFSAPATAAGKGEVYFFAFTTTKSTGATQFDPPSGNTCTKSKFASLAVAEREMKTPSGCTRIRVDKGTAGRLLVEFACESMKTSRMYVVGTEMCGAHLAQRRKVGGETTNVGKAGSPTSDDSSPPRRESNGILPAKHRVRPSPDECFNALWDCTGKYVDAQVKGDGRITLDMKNTFIKCLSTVGVPEDLVRPRVRGSGINAFEWEEICSMRKP